MLIIANSSKPATTTSKVTKFADASFNVLAEIRVGRARVHGLEEHVLPEVRGEDLDDCHLLLVVIPRSSSGFHILSDLGLPRVDGRQNVSEPSAGTRLTNLIPEGEIAQLHAVYDEVVGLPPGFKAVAEATGVAGVVHSLGLTT